MNATLHQKPKGKKISAFPERRMSYAKGLDHRSKIMKTMEEWTRKLQVALASIQDSNEMIVAAALLDALADEDECGAFLLTEIPETNRLRLEDIEIDNDILDALTAKYGDQAPQRATTWLIEWLHEHGPPLWWLGWRFEHCDIRGKRGLGLKIESDNVVYCFRARRTVGITLWDGPDLIRSTLIPIPRWRMA